MISQIFPLCLKSMHVIGVIYGGTTGSGTLLFRIRVPYPHFFRTKSKEFAVICCQQRRSVEIKLNKTVFGRSSARTSLWELTMLSQTPESDEEGILPPHSPPLSPRESGPKCASFSFWIGTSTFRPKLCHWWQSHNIILGPIIRVNLQTNEKSLIIRLQIHPNNRPCRV